MSGCGNSACWRGESVWAVGNVTVVVAWWCVYLVWAVVLSRWCCVDVVGVVVGCDGL